MAYWGIAYPSGPHVNRPMAALDTWQQADVKLSLEWF
jgi:hypothetical protein